MRLYPKVVDVGQSFVGCKVHTLPNQNMTLREIIKRFIRKESLPIEKRGVYIENLDDLEKLAKADIFDRIERATQLEGYIAKAETRMSELKKAAEAKAVVPAKGGEASEPTPAGQGAAASAATPLA